jgi:hypothetical protein
MPTHDGLGPDDGDCVKNAGAATVQPDKQGTIDPTQMWFAWRSLSQDIELMPQYYDLGFQLLSRPEAVAQHADEQEADCYHAAIMFRFAADRESIGWSFRKRQPRTKRSGRSFYLPATCRKLSSAGQESVPPVVKAIRARRMQKDQRQAGHTIPPSHSGRQASVPHPCCHKESAVAYL